MDDELAFLRAIAVAPDDDAPRLVFADWLEERGDPREAFVRGELDRHRRPAEPVHRPVTGLADRLDGRWVERYLQLRPAAAGVRRDLAVVADAKGLIDVRGGEPETVLLVDGRPVALNWDDCQGSVGQYLVFTGHTRGPELARQLAEWAADGVDDRPLADQVGPLLATFAAGTYGLVYTPSTAVRSIAQYGPPSGPVGTRALQGYYPAEDRILVGTQPDESFDEGRFAFHREQIRAGGRPVVLTVAAEGAWCEFVIDGHHKLLAYGRRNVPPAILSIVRWDAPAITAAEGIGFFPRGHRGLAEYRRMKRLMTG